VVPVVLDEPFGSASALKMAYASANKVSIAVTALCMAMAARYNVEALLMTEWDRGNPDATRASHDRISVAAPKAWRWVGEMHEIADTALSAGLPDGFHRAAAELFDRWSGHRPPDGDRNAVVEDVAALIEELMQSSTAKGHINPTTISSATAT